MAKVFQSRLTAGATGAAGGAAALALAVQLIGGHEGLRTRAYKDVIGVWTICYGHTENVRSGMVFTKAECDKQFGDDIVKYEKQMVSCLVEPKKIPIHVYIASLDIEYNIGEGAFCKSSIVTALNVGAYKTACERQLRYTMAGGRRIPGLYKRRVETMNFCMQDAA